MKKKKFVSLRSWSQIYSRCDSVILEITKCRIPSTQIFSFLRNITKREIHLANSILFFAYQSLDLEQMHTCCALYISFSYIVPL